MSTTQIGKESALLLRLWKKIPVLIRAILVGLLVTQVGVGIWSALYLKARPLYAVLGMAGVLLIYVLYFSGKGWPKSTQATRADCFREYLLPKIVWLWGIAAAILFVAIVQSSFVVTYRIVEYPADRIASFYSIDTSSKALAWLTIIMASCVAGICEEIGFRGYMQKPLENRYNYIIATVITSAVFVLVHLHQAWAGPVLFHIFAVGVLLSLMAHYSRSLLPGIIGHSVMDIFNFSYWWTGMVGKFDKKPLSVTGIDAHFLIWLAVLIVCLMLIGVVLVKIRKIRAMV